MPITEPPTTGMPFSQGDILKDVRLFYSNRGKDALWESAEDPKAKLSMVLSRQCGVEHKKSLIVAAVDKYTGDVPATLDFEAAELYLENLRDGNKMPDVFYLGQLPGMSGRFYARLDSLHTIEVPQKPEERRKFLDENRVASLNIDYVRHLHLRIFGAIASMGFEDDRWHADGDLKWLIAKGESEIAKEQEIQKLAAVARETEGRSMPADQATRDQAKIDKLRKRIEPYVTEMKRRYPDAPGTESGSERGSKSPSAPGTASPSDSSASSPAE